MIMENISANELKQQQAYNKAIRLLAIREHSQTELKKKLSVFPLSVVDHVLAQLQQQGYQSDERFSEVLVHSKIAAGKGYLFIKQVLTQHDIQADIIERYLDGIEDTQWQRYCYQVWSKKFATHSHPDSINEQSAIEHSDEKEREEDYQSKAKRLYKQQHFLSQRGFRAKDWQPFL